MTTISLLPVVLSGGSGTRLWPLSRDSYPKQLHALTGECSMLQQTALRMTSFQGPLEVLSPCIVCNNEYRFVSADQLSTVGIQPSAILLEPFGKNTAPALTLAALFATREGQNPILLAMPADHTVGNLPAFHEAVLRGVSSLENSTIVTFGVQPTRPETGYGYLKIGAEADAGSYKLEAFVEKPTADKAKEYMQHGGYLWNSGLFMMHAETWLSAIKFFNPDIFEACTRALNNANYDLDFIRIESADFNTCPPDSIDYAVMEKLCSGGGLSISPIVVPLDAGWSDVGSWDAVWQVLEKDQFGNAHHGDTLTAGSSDSLFFSEGRLVTGVGLKGIIVVETADAVLVVDKQHSQDVKPLVNALKQKRKLLTTSHRKTYRPWGWYDSIDAGERFQVKRIVVKPGASLSLQMHHHRAEHWIVVRGTAEVRNGPDTMLLSENESTYIPIGHIHRLSNPGKVPLEIIEVQTGAYLGEDDIVRFEDSYGRVKNV